MNLRTLGDLSLEGSDFRRSKNLLLLAFLVMEGPQERRHLAELFWPRSTPGQGLRNLATTMTRLRKAAEGVVETDGVRAWTSVDCDARDFLAALERGEHLQAHKLYGGRFLDGKIRNLGAELEEWAYQTRERLAGHMREALIRRAEIEAADGDFKTAAKRADEVYRLASGLPVEPEDLERLHVLMVAGGSLHAGEVQKEASKFGLSLEVSTTDAKKLLGRERRREKAFQPISGTSFVGRESELLEVTQLLAQPECRLLTLIGVGGVGKTRLAQEVARGVQRSDRYPEGVFFVPLEALTDAASLPAVVADALELTLSGQEDAGSVVKRFLAEKRVLLVLDNFEHLLEGTSFVRELIDSCPSLKLLITSRERLNLEPEWACEVEGLAFPEGSATVERARYFGAVALFLQRARRARQRFSLTSEKLPAVIRICQLVDGMPLAIELAASWLRALPVGEVAMLLEANIDFLESPTRDAPEGQRSVRVVFDRSWTLLSEREKEVMRRLSVFQGGFSRKAAAVVAGATLPMLARLVDKSMLHMSQDSRYDRHPLLSQYTREKLAELPEEHAQAVQQHGRYYLGFVRELEPELWTLNRKQAFRMFQEELANTRAAWDWAVANVRVEEIEQTTPAMYDLFRFRLLEGLKHFGTTREFFGSVAEHLDDTDASHLCALGTVLVHQVLDPAQMHRVPDFLWVRSIAKRAIELLRSQGKPRSLSRGCIALGESYFLMGDSAQGTKWFRRALTLARENGESGDIFHALMLMDLAAEARGERYRRFVQEALEEVRALNNLPGVAWFLKGSGESLVYDRRFKESKALFREAIRIARELGFHLVVIFSMLHLARASYELGEIDQASAYAEEAHQEVEETGLTHFAPFTLAWLSRMAMARGDFEGARELVRRSLKGGWVRKYKFQVVRALMVFAELRAAEGKPSEAVVLLMLIIEERSIGNREKSEARSILAELRDSLAPAEFAAAEDRGRGMKLAEVVEDLTGAFVESDAIVDKK